MRLVEAVRPLSFRVLGGTWLFGWVLGCLILGMSIGVGWGTSCRCRGLFVCFANQPGDLDALLDALIQDKRDVGNVSGGQAIRYLRLHEARCAAKPVHGQLLL